MSGFFNNARAIAKRCLCPPDKFDAFSSKKVSYHNGNSLINSCTQACLHTCITSSKDCLIHNYTRFL